MVVVVLTRSGIELPRGMPEPGLPVVGRLAGASAVAPDVPVALWVVARRARLLEPRMLVGSVIRNKIHNYANVSFFCFGHQMIKISHRAVQRIDCSVIGDVVTKIDERRGVHRCNPDGADAKIMQIVETRSDAVDVDVT